MLSSAIRPPRAFLSRGLFSQCCQNALIALNHFGFALFELVREASVPSLPSLRRSPLNSFFSLLSIDSCFPLPLSHADSLSRLVSTRMTQAAQVQRVSRAAARHGRRRLSDRRARTGAARQSGAPRARAAAETQGTVTRVNCAGELVAAVSMGACALGCWCSGGCRCLYKEGIEQLE
jgi:hypothetical protein